MSLYTSNVWNAIEQNDPPKSRIGRFLMANFLAATTQKLVVGLTRDPESSKTQRILEFHQVRSIRDYWIDRDDECMEGLLGAHETESGSDIRYVLATDQREVEVFAGTQGLVYDA